MEKQYIIPVAGQTYRNRNGGEYLCTGNTFYVDDAQKQRFLSLGEHIAYMERVKDGWRLTAHGVIQYADDPLSGTTPPAGTSRTEHRLNRSLEGIRPPCAGAPSRPF